MAQDIAEHVAHALAAQRLGRVTEHDTSSLAWRLFFIDKRMERIRQATDERDYATLDAEARSLVVALDRWRPCPQTSPD